jgi:hypothetical protein
MILICRRCCLLNTNNVIKDSYLWYICMAYITFMCFRDMEQYSAARRDPVRTLV